MPIALVRRDERRLLALLLQLFEFLQLPRHHALVALRPYPAPVPIVEAGNFGAVGAIVAIAFAERDLLRRLFRNGFLKIGEVGVVVVADGADRKTARTIAERTDDPQQSLPETEDIARARHTLLFRERRIDETPEELQDGGKAEFLRFGGAGALVDAEDAARRRPDGIRQRLQDSPMQTCSVSGRSASSSSSVRTPVINARPEFRRQDVDFEAERAEAGFDAEMPRRQPAVARALVAPVGFLRRGDEARMAQIFQLLGEPVGDLSIFRSTSMSMYCTGTLPLQRNAPAGMRCTKTITLLQ